MAKVDCKHRVFEASVNVNFMEDTGRYCADVGIKCKDCGTPFRFLGLKTGLDLEGAAVSVDGAEARLAIAPADEVIASVDDVLTGFTVRKPKLSLDKDTDVRGGMDISADGTAVAGGF